MKRRKTEALAMLGLAMRAGAVARGTDATRRAIQDGSASLVLMAQDASEVQREKVLRLLRHCDTPRAVVGSRAELGAAVGTMPLSAVAVTAESLAAQVLGRLSTEADVGRVREDRR